VTNKAHIQSRNGKNDSEKLGQPCEHINMPRNYQLFAYWRPTEKVCNRRKNLDFEGYLNFVPPILVQTGLNVHSSILDKGYPGSFPEVERWPPIPSSVKVKEIAKPYLYSPSVPS